MKKLQLLLALAFFFAVNLQAQTITSFSPASGAIGSSVTITGTNFNTTAAQNIVFFGATKAVVTAASATSLTVTVPLGATYQYFTVTNLVTGLTAYSAKPFIVTLAGDIAFIPRVGISTSTFMKSVSIGDIDGDGKADLVVVNFYNNTGSVFRNTSTSGSVSFATKVDFATGLEPQSVSIGDLDGDGKPDLVVANNGTNTVSVFRNTSTSGSISVATKVDYTTGYNSSSLSIGDFDGDGKPDLAVTNDQDFTVSVLRNTSTAGSINFATKVDFTTGSNPFSVSIGDIDGDGKPDLATANYGSDKVSVLRNTSTMGSLSFATKVDFATGSQPYSVSIGDIDGDGKPDLAVANFFSDKLSVLRNTSTSGSVSFATKIDFATASEPRSVSIGDIDGDGKPDLAAANANANTVSVLRNTSTSGSISFSTKIDFTTGLQPKSVSIGDIDGDGKPDLTVAGSSSISVIRQGIPLPPSISSQSTASQTQCQYLSGLSGLSGFYFSTISVTVTGDGLSYQWYSNASNSNTGGTPVTNGGNSNSYDPPANIVGTKYYYCVVTNPIGTVTSSVSGAMITLARPTPSITGAANVNYGNTVTLDAGSFTSYLWSGTGATTRTLAITASGAYSYTVTVTDNYGCTGTATASGTIYGTSITSFSPASGAIGSSVTITGTNFNTTASQNIVFFGATRAVVTAASATSLTVTVPLGATYQYLSVTNLATGLTAYSAKPFIVTLAGGIVFNPKVDFATGTTPYSVNIVDIDGDGKPDVTVLNTSDRTVSVFRNTSTSGSVSFATKIDFATGSTPYSVNIGDIDGDGKPDLVVLNSNGQSVSVLRNTSTLGSVSFATKVDFLMDPGPFGLSIGDLDGDGKPDLAVVNSSYNRISVFLNTSTIGSVSFATSVIFTTGINPQSVSIGDIDGDGKPDLAVANYFASTLSVFRSTSTTGSVSFANKVDFATGLNPESVKIGDIDGDGKPDLATANYGDNTLSVLRNTSTSGSISYAAKVDLATGSQPSSINIGDIDGDGKPDLATANYGAGNVSVLRNTSTSGSVSFATKVDLTTGTNPRSVSIGDIDGDGKPDLQVVMSFGSNTLSVIKQTTSTSISSQSTATQTQCLNSNFSAISVTAAGDALSYQWYSNASNSNSGGTTLNAGNGAQTNTYTPQSSVAGTLYYYCVVTGTSGTATSSVSGAFITNTLPTLSANAGGAATVCVNATTAAFTNAQAGGTWSIVAGTGTASVSTGGVVTGLTAGTVSVVYTYSNGTCSNSVSSSVTVNALPTLSANGGGAASVCVNATTAAFTNAQAGGTWSIVSGTGTASVSTGGVVTGLTAGTVSVKYTYSNGTCSNSVSSSVTVNALPTLSANAGGAATVCVNATTAAFTNAQAGGTWSIVAGTGTASVSTGGVVTGLTAGTVSVKYTYSNGTCSNSVSSSVTVNALPSITASTTAIAVCQSVSAQNTSLAYSATTNTPTTYSISWTATPTNSFVAVTDATVTTSPISIAVPANTAAETYTGTLTVTNANGCVSNGTNFTFTVNALPTLTTGSAITPANGATTADLTAGVSSDGNVKYYSDNAYTTEVTAPTVVTIAQTYYIRATLNGCSTDGSMVVNDFSTAIAPPTITSFTPSSGNPGTLVTITGTDLGNSSIAFTIGGTPAIVISKTNTSLVGMVMPGSSTGTIAISNTAGTVTSSATFTVTATPYPSVQQGTKLVGIGAAGFMTQGTSVSLSADGNTAIVGGPYNNSNAGAVWVYTKSGNAWSSQGSKLVATDATGNAQQGISVSLSADGNTAIVGGNWDNGEVGAAWVYTRSGSTWTQQGNKLVGTGANGNSWQGISVSLSADGNTAMVGGANDNNNLGAVWIYARSGSTWTQQGSKLVGTDAVGSLVQQGWSVALSADGNTALVGGYYDNNGAGAAWVYNRSGSTWTQQGSKLVGTGNAGNAQQGLSVALSANGNTAMVGGNGDNNYAGAAWVYTRSGSTWIQQGSKLVGTGAEVATSPFPDFPSQGASQGSSVSLSADGNTALVGGRSDNSNAGATWVYARSGNTWTQQGAKLAGTGIVGNSEQGTSVSLSADGKTAMVGGPWDNDGAGAAWVYVEGNSCTNVGLVSATATASPICADATTTLTYSGLTGTNASVIWTENVDGTGTTYGTGITSNPVGPGTYYAYATGDCGSAISIAVTVATTPKTNPTFTQVSAICSGATMVALPPTSVNEIEGIWSPELNNLEITEYTFTPTEGQCANIATMTITVTPATTNGSVTTSICAGDSYTWPLPEGTGLTYTTAQTGLTNLVGCNTATLNLTINNLSITSQPTSQTICKAIGASATISVAVTGATPTYQWYAQTASSTTVWTALTNNANYAGVTGPALTITRTTTAVPATGTKYRVAVSNACVPNGLYSDNVALLEQTVLSKAAAITAKSATNGTLTPALTSCQGNSLNLTLAAGSVGNIQWQSSTYGISYSNVGTPIAQSSLSATNLAISFNTGTLTQDTWFRVVASNGVCNSINGTPIKITVSSPANAGTINGGDVTVCAPVATGLDANGNALTTAITNIISLSLGDYTQGATIVWQKSTNYSAAIPTWATVANLTATTHTGASYSGVGTNALTVGNLIADTWYRVQVTNGACIAFTVPVKITVNKSAVAGAVTATTNGIATSSVCTGGDITFTSAAYTGSSIQWEVSTTSATTGFQAVNGANQLAFTMNAISYAPLSKFYVRSVVTSGNCTIARSSVKTITVNPLSVAGTATGGGTICSGANGTLALSGYTGTIQWQYSTDGINYYRAPYRQIVSTVSTLFNPDNATTFTTVASTGIASTYVLSALTADTYFRAKITSGACTAVYSNVIKYTIGTVAASGTITTANATVCSGTGTTLTLAGSVGAIKWFKSTNWTAATPTWTAVTTSTSATLATGNLTVSTAYRVMTTIGDCAAGSTSGIVTVLVNSATLAKTITANVTTPSGATSVLAICTGNVKTLTIGAGSIGAIQWQRSIASATLGFTDIADATSASYTVVSPTVGANYFRAKFTNSCGVSVFGTAIAVYYKDCPQTKTVAELETETFKVIGSPNPYTNTFQLDITTQSSASVEVRVYDMIGKLIEVRNSGVAELVAMEIGDNYATGIYNVIVTQGTETKTLRMIKK